jgi:hypothetical protein
MGNIWGPIQTAFLWFSGSSKNHNSAHGPTSTASCNGSFSWAKKKWRRPGSNRRPSVDSFSKISLQNSSLTNQSDRQPEHQRLHTCLIGCISIYYYYLVSHQHNQSTALSGTGASMVYSPARHSDRYGTSSQLRLEYGDVAQALHHVSNRAHRGEQ